MIKAKTGRIPVIAKKLGIPDELVQERLSFTVMLTATLDRIIFEEGVAPCDITIGGEGDYRVKVDTNEDIIAKL